MSNLFNLADVIDNTQDQTPNTWLASATQHPNNSRTLGIVSKRHSISASASMRS